MKKIPPQLAQTDFLLCKKSYSSDHNPILRKAQYRNMVCLIWPVVEFFKELNKTFIYTYMSPLAYVK